MSLFGFFASRAGPSREEHSRERRIAKAQRRMVERDLVGRDVVDRKVIDAMSRVPRHLFVEEKFRDSAYRDQPLEIGHGQTISQPYMVAKMSELLEIRIGDKVLEIGGGCGYQTAVLLELGARVFCVEIIPALAQSLEERLKKLGYRNFEIACHDGHQGWSEHAPYNSILVAAAAPSLPAALMEQTAPEGKILAPIGTDQGDQMLKRWTREGTGWRCEEIMPVRFVPLVGGGSETP